MIKKGDARIWPAIRKSIPEHYAKLSSHDLHPNGKLIPISYRFLHEATYIISYRFSCEATGYAGNTMLGIAAKFLYFIEFSM